MSPEERLKFREHVATLSPEEALQEVIGLIHQAHSPRQAEWIASRRAKMLGNKNAEKSIQV